MKAKVFALLPAILPLAEIAALDQTPNTQIRRRRERVMDRAVHIEEGIIRDIPRMPRLCDGMAVRKGRIDIGGCNLCREQEGKGIPLGLTNGVAAGALTASILILPGPRRLPG